MKRIAIVIALSAALVAPSVAGAATIKQEGRIVGDKATKVKLRVQTKGGKPDKVAGFTAKNVRVRCENGPSRITFSALQPIKVEESKFKVKLSDGEGGVLRIQGKVKDRGRQTRGSLKSNEFEAENGKMCRAPKQRFRTAAG